MSTRPAGPSNRRGMKRDYAGECPVTIQLRSFFDGCAAAGAQALAAGPHLRFRRRLAGKTIAINAASPYLVDEFLPALLSLPAAGDDAPALTLDIWTSDGKRHMPPPPPWSWNDPDVQQTRFSFFADGIVCRFFMEGPRVMLLDVEKRHGLVWARESREIPHWVHWAPARNLLQWWAINEDHPILHCASVGLNGAGVLIPAVSGSGKTSTALACLLDGMDYLGDDTCIYTPGERPLVHRIYGSATVTESNLLRYPSLEEHICFRHPERANKAVLLVDRFRPCQLVETLEVTSILVPVITGKPGTTIEPARSLTAMHALMPASLMEFWSPFGQQRMAQQMSELVRRVPCYEVRLGTDIPGIAEAIRTHLQRHPAHLSTQVATRPQ